MITELNCQSATRLKMMYSIVFMQYFILFLTLTMSACGLVLSIFVILKLPYLNYLKSLKISQF